MSSMITGNSGYSIFGVYKGGGDASSAGTVAGLFNSTGTSATYENSQTAFIYSSGAGSYSSTTSSSGFSSCSSASYVA